MAELARVIQGPQIRGAPSALAHFVENYRGEKKTFEFLIDGPRGTGKTVGVGWLLRYWIDRYPGIRILFVRKTRKSITESFCPDFEGIVLEHDMDVKSGAQAANRQAYRWPDKKGGVIVLAGLDDPGKVYSTNWDVVVCEEAAQFTEKGFIDFYGTLRQFTPGMPCQILIALTNPRGPNHWLLRRWKNGSAIRYKSLHVDNPKWYREDGTPTEEGTAYIDGLRKLPGVLYDRNYLGLWKSNEGAVWETFDEDKHIITELPVNFRWFGSALDWGYTEPSAHLVGGKTEDNKIIVVSETYQQKRGIPWWATEVISEKQKWKIAALKVDPSRPEIVDYFNQESRRLNPGASIPWASGADNKRATTGEDLGGLDLVRNYMDRDALLFMDNRLQHGPDPELVDRSEPTSVVGEIPDYIWYRPQNAEDDPSESRDRTDPNCVDHGCDALRYLVRLMHDYDFGPPRATEKPVFDDEAMAMRRAMGIG